MAYDEEQQKRTRVVVETPTARREESYTSTTRNPDRDGGYSTGMIATVAIVAIAATALLMFFLLNRGDATNSNTNVTVTTAATPLPAAPTPVIIQQQPVQQPQPIIVQAPPATTQPAPIIVSPPPADTTASTPVPPDDAGIESRIGRAFTADPDLSAAGITVTVVNGQATLIGAVKTADLKSHAERLAHGIKGVKTVDNKLTVEGTLPE